MTSTLRTPGGHRRRRYLARALLLILPLPAGTATAQTTTELRGVVRTGGAPVADAYVVVTGSGISAVTNAAGLYHLRGIPPGLHHVTVEYLGYRTEEATLQFSAGVPLRHDVELVVAAVRGEPLRAAAIAASPQLRGFYERRDRRQGIYFTPTDIDRMQTRQFTDVLRRVPGLQLTAVSGPFGTSYVAQMGRTTGAGARGCPALFIMNGMPFPVGLDIGIDSFIRPDEVAGIEVYTGSNMPAQFSGGHPNARCGAVVIWTHSGRTPR